MHCAVNRTTVSGHVAGPDQRVSRLPAFKAVTLGAAYLLRLEDVMGSITSGMLANFTIPGESPLTVDAAMVKDIPIWGSVQEERVRPVK